MESTGYKNGGGVHPLLKSGEQTISFRGKEEQFSAAMTCSDVRVEVGHTDHTSSSSSMTTRVITNYPWDHQYISGSLVAVHCAGNYLAYAIKAPQKSSGMVRIIDRRSGERGLIKNIRGMVRDLAFAHLSQRVILGFTDQYGTLYVCEVTPSNTEGSLNTEMLLEVNSESEEASDHHRIIWCQYIPDDQAGDDDSDDPAYLLVLTHGKRAEIWNINAVLREYGRGHIQRDRIVTGFLQMEHHSAPITDAAFSPDGTALATAALDGYVKFFQVYMADEEKSPRCLHEWNPHNGQQLSALFFLDNHKHPTPEVQFWKYAVTGACDNSELRVWSCESWHCHQTLRFVPEKGSQTPILKFKAAMDPSANFLLLSDLHHRVMYVVVINQDGVNAIAANSNNADSLNLKAARLVSVSELPVTYPALFLAVTDSAWKPYKRWKHDHGHDHARNMHEEGEEEGDGVDRVDVVDGVVMRFVFINTKSLQEATLRFQPSMPTTAIKPPAMDLSASVDSIAIRDGLTDLSMSISTSMSEAETGVVADGGGTEVQPPPPPPPDALTSPQSSSMASQHNALQTPPATQPTMNLLTPDSFSSPRKPEELEADEDTSEDFASLANKVAPMSQKLESAQFNSDYGNDTLSLLLRCGSGTLLQTSEAEGTNSLNILSSVVAGSSKSPPATSLPPPPPSSKTPPALDFQNPEDAPLATSEVVASASQGQRGGVSASSSPSLEVQQILHSQNGKGADFTEDENEHVRTNEEQEIGDDDDEEEDEEEEEEEELDEEDEPEALRQSRPLPKPQPPPLPEPQAKSHSSSATLPQPPSMPEPLSLRQPPSSIPHIPSSSIPKAPPGPIQKPHPPLSAPQPSIPAPQPPIPSLPPTPSLPHPSQVPKLPLTSPLLPNMSPLSSMSPTQKSQEAQHNKLPALPLDVFASVKSLPNQFTCEQLEAEIKNRSSASPSTQLTCDQLEAELKNQSSVQSDSPHSSVNQDASATELAELRNLMKTYMSVTREQNKEVLSQTRELTSKIDKALHQVNQLARKVEEVSAAQSAVSADLPRMVAASIRPVLEATVRGEMRLTVLPDVIKSLDPMRQHVSQDVHALMKTTENHVIDSISKLVHSKSFVDGLGGTVGAVVCPTVQNSCREAYNKVLIPGLNVLTQQVFAQVNDSFCKGTREYLSNVESEVQSGRAAVQESVGKATQSLNSVCSSLNNQTKNLQENITKLNAQQKAFSESLPESLRNLVKDEVARALQEHQATVDARSRAHTPAPMAHPQNPKVAQQQVQALISSGQFNTAFKQALSASDLSLVVFVCERVNPQQVFNITPCPLSQDVLLSLVNQLSHDLSTFTELKFKYLEEAVMNLDASHPVTREHMRPVLQGFQRNLHTHLSANPNHKKVKMLLMAVNHLVAL